MRRIVLICICLIALAASAAQAYPAFGSLMVSGGSWCQGQGVDVYSNGYVGYWSGINNYVNGEYVGVKWQCVELARRLYEIRGWHSSPFGIDYAYQIWGRASALGMVQHPIGSGYVPVPGDMMVFDSGLSGSGGAGHVALVDTVDASNIYVCEQNSSDTGRRSYARNSSPAHCYGFVHDPDNPLTYCTPANIWWTWTPTENRWYRSNEHLTYGTSGSNISVATSAMYLADAGLGWHDYWAHAWNGCGDVTVHWAGGWDNQAPTASRTGGAAPNTWYNTSQTVSWSASDGHSGVKRQWYQWAGGGWNESGGPASLPEGKSALEVKVEDNAWNGGSQDGNVAVVNLGEYWKDTANPSLSLSGPATSTWLNTPQTVTWSATDATSGILDKKLTWDNGGQTNASPTAIPQGKRSATVWAKDNALNEATQTYGPWWIDTTPPVPGVALSPSAPNGENGWYVSDPTMSVVATDPNGTDGSGVNATFYTLDGAPEAPFTVPVLVSGDGIHTCSARATDVAGNAGSTGDVIVKIDTTPPVFDSIYTDSESRSLNTLVATWSCSDPDSGIADYQYWIGSTAGASDIAGATLTHGNNWAYAMNLDLMPGQTCYFSVRAKNVAGLWSDVVHSALITANQGGYDASPSLNSGGVSVSPRASANYRIVDSIGQFVVSTSESPSFVMEHGYWHAEIPILEADGPGAAKAIANGQTLQIGSQVKPVVVISGTSTFADRFYIESLDRISGIACQYGAAGGPALVEGDRVYVIGKLNTIGNERMLQFASPTFVTRLDPLAPMYIGVPFLGGVALNQWTPGVLDGIGLNNVDLLVRTYAGLVSYRDPQGRFFYLDNGDNLYDGSGYGIRIVCDGFAGGGKLAMSAYGETVIVTGISSVVTINNQAVRALRPRRQTDIQVLN